MTSQEISQDEAFERNQWHESKRFMDDVRGRVRGKGLRIVYPEGGEERPLYGVLNELEMAHSHAAREDRHHAAILVPEAAPQSFLMPSPP